MIDLAALNWWAILLATATAFALGALWYGPMFGKAWVRALGKSEDEIQPSPSPFVISAVAALITCVALAAVMQGLGLTGALAGLALGLLLGIGFIATSMASDSAFCGWGWKLWAIQSGYRVVYSALMGGIIGIWP
jgi:Kef-type K+ transport system membrane component KefB